MKAQRDISHDLDQAPLDDRGREEELRLLAHFDSHELAMFAFEASVRGDMDADAVIRAAVTAFERKAGTGSRNR